MKPTKATTQSNEFRSSDLYLSAYLQVAGAPMIRTEREQNRVYFVFDVSIVNIEELKAAWFNNTGKVPAQPYAHSVRSLKSLCHSM